MSRYEERSKLIEESCGNGKDRVSAFDALSPVPPAVLLGIKQKQGGSHTGARPVKIVTVQTAHLPDRHISGGTKWTTLISNSISSMPAPTWA